MKIIITESRLERLAINWLNDNYGDLEPYETEEEPDYIFYKKGNRVIFEYNKNSEAIYVNYDEIWKIFDDYFTMEYEQIQHIIKMWVEGQYNLSVTTTSGIEMN
jgi:hypothetical protein